jgi:hypothetical protein
MGRIIFLLRQSLIVLGLYVGNANAEVINEPTQRYYAQYAILADDAIRSALNDFANLLGPNIKIVTRECGMINAFYSPSEKSIILCYEYLADGSNFISEAYKRESPATQAELNLGIFFYVLLHEIGHAVIDAQKIPVIGGEEDAADRIAAITMLEIAKSKPSLTRNMFVGFLSYNWNKRHGFMTKLLSGNNLFADEHPFNEQRVFNMVCLAYGSNPYLFVDVAQAFKLPPSRATRCSDEYQDTRTAISTLIK